LIFEVHGVGNGAMWDVGWQGNIIYIEVRHINLTGRTWQMEWNTYIGVLN
jgi:hypothetical protein